MVNWGSWEIKGGQFLLNNLVTKKRGRWSQLERYESSEKVHVFIFKNKYGRRIFLWWRGAKTSRILGKDTENWWGNSRGGKVSRQKCELQELEAWVLSGTDKKNWKRRWLGTSPLMASVYEVIWDMLMERQKETLSTWGERIPELEYRTLWTQ